MKNSNPMCNHMSLEVNPAVPTVTTVAMAARARFTIGATKRHGGTRRATGSEPTT